VVFGQVNDELVPAGLGIQRQRGFEAMLPVETEAQKIDINSLALASEKIRINGIAGDICTGVRSLRV
jgi:hypothetical protein